MKCTTDKYEDLYARWLENPEKLVDWAEVPPDGKVLDLCGGTGAVAKVCADRGYDTYLLDLNPRCDDPRVKQFSGQAEFASWNSEINQEFDVIFCRQALGYLRLNILAHSIHNVLKPGGSFVYNNFAHPRWKASTYKHGGKRFAEASAYFGQHVFHIQLGLGIGLDITHFRWHKHEEIMETFEPPLYDVQYEKRNRSYRYKCTKRKVE